MSLRSALLSVAGNLVSPGMGAASEAASILVDCFVMPVQPGAGCADLADPASSQVVFYPYRSAGSGRPLPVTPAAERVAPWLQFTVVSLWMALFLMILTVLGMLAAVMLPALLGMDKVTLGTVPGVFVPLALVVIALGLLGAWIYTVMIRLTRDWRDFALHMAAALDHDARNAQWRDTAVF